MDEQNPSPTLHSFVAFNSKHLTRRDKKHHAFIKIIRLLPVFYLAIEIPFQGNRIKIKYQAERITAGRMADRFQIDDTDEGMLRFGEPHHLVILTYGFDPLWWHVIQCTI